MERGVGDSQWEQRGDGEVPGCEASRRTSLGRLPGELALPECGLGFWGRLLPSLLSVHSPVPMGIPSEGAGNTLEEALSVFCAELVHIRWARRCCRQLCVMEDGTACQGRTRFLSLGNAGGRLVLENILCRVPVEKIQNPSLLPREVYSLVNPSFCLRVCPSICSLTPPSESSY